MYAYHRALQVSLMPRGWRGLCVQQLKAECWRAAAVAGV